MPLLPLPGPWPDTVFAMQDYRHCLWQGGQKVTYDVKDDIRTLADFRVLETEHGLFRNARLDSSRTCVYWTERVDLPSDTILEYGQPAGENCSRKI